MTTTTSLPEGFTYSIFANTEACEDFIWGFLYHNGLQYHSPIELDNGQVKLVYEDKFDK